MTKMLKVRAVDPHLVQDYRAMQDKVLRYVGRRFNSAVFDEWNQTHRDLRPVFAEIMLQVHQNTGEVVEVPNTSEFRKEVKLGTLEPADEATCVACGLQPVVYHFI